MRKACLLLDFGLRTIAKRGVPRSSTITNHIPTGLIYGEFLGELTLIFGAMRTIAIRFLRGFPASAEKLFPRCFIWKNGAVFVSHECSFYLGCWKGERSQNFQTLSMGFLSTRRGAGTAPWSKQCHQAQYFYIPSLHRDSSPMSWGVGQGGLANFLHQRGINILPLCPFSVS